MCTPQEILRIFVTDPQISSLIVQRKLKRQLAAGEDPALVKDNEFYVFELQMKPLGDSKGGAAMASVCIAFFLLLVPCYVSSLSRTTPKTFS